jgi:hypothetical protein
VVSDAAAAERFAAQLLCGPPGRGAEEITGRLLAIQGQDPRGARLAIRARSRGLSAADVDRALTAGALLITWLNRGTLHLVRRDDYWWLHPLVTPPLFTASARRLAQEGVSPDAADTALQVIERSLTADGPLTRAQLRDRISAAGVRTEGQALVHLLLLASLRGVIVRGPMAGREHAYALVRDWLGTAPGPFDRDAALTELARRFLAGHGPASDADLAKWAGLPLRDARRGLAAIAGELAPRDDGLAALAPAPAPAPARVPEPVLLGAFDPLLHGWVSRQPILGERQGIVTTNGLFRPFLLVEGRAAGLWSLAGGKIMLRPFEPLPAPVTAALEAEAADVRRFLKLG